jgi:hypothetical protein
VQWRGQKDCNKILRDAVDRAAHAESPFTSDSGNQILRDAQAS